MGMTMGHHGSGGDEQARNKHQERMIERVSDALVLDANQKQRLTVLGQKWHAFQEAERASSHDKDPRQAMLGLLAGDHLDQKGAQAWVEQRTQTLRSQSPELIKAAADFFDSLRPEQQQKVRKFIAHGSHAKMGGKGMMLHQEASDHADVPAHSGH
ncbi:MAG: Spy/CpxP family protein refolding chaperone [Leptothrix ochracea]|uniref:Spy/CpxP family protein refolding chaperone n=3 Tax=Leptothrix ochracea TaxID=735331 RepID=UPI0034E20A75